MNAAAALDRADRDNSPIAPFGDDLAHKRPYDVQADFLSRRAQRLASLPIGYKVALTSPESQAALRTDRPASGRLLAADVVPSGSEIDLREHFSPLLEAELIFRVRTDLPGRASPAEIARTCDVAAGLECPDSRYRDWFGGDFPTLALPDVIADNCLAGLVVVGEHWVPATDLDFPSVTAQLFVRSERVTEGTGASVLGDPLRAMAWLSAQLAERGTALTAGTLVSSGTFTAPVVARTGKAQCVFSAGLGEAWATFV